MTPTETRQKRWLLALGGLALVVTTSCASVMVARSGVANVGEIYAPETRAEVRAAFGEADETRTRPDGFIVEERTIRQEVPEVCGGNAINSDRPRCIALGAAYFFLLGLPELGVLPTTVARSERAKLHYTFVYDAEDRVLCRYGGPASLHERFAVAIAPVTEALSQRLAAEGCPSWETCVTGYAEEARRRAACVEYPLSPTEEATLRELITVAAYADAGRLSKDVARMRIAQCAPLKPNRPSCVPPPPGE